MKKYLSFLSENFQFFGVKFSVYLNRHFFVMSQSVSTEVMWPSSGSKALPLELKLDKLQTALWSLAAPKTYVFVGKLWRFFFLFIK